MKTKAVTILLADDHVLFRSALSLLIASLDFNSRILHAANGREALDMIATEKIDLVLLDVQMPVLSGIGFLKAVSVTKSCPPVIILTQFAETSLVLHLMNLGARGFLLKSCDAAELADAIQAVLTNGMFHNKIVLDAVQDNISKGKGLPSLEISARELEVLSLMKLGKTNKEISTQLNLSLRTIESYRKSLLRKTQCHNVGEVVNLAFRTGIV